MDGATKEMPLNFLVVGLGSAGQRHIRAIRNLYPDSTVYVISQCENRKLISADLTHYIPGIDPLEHYRLTRVSDVKEMKTESVDLSIIATPPFLHASSYRLVEQISERILIEKPMSSTLLESIQMLQMFAQNSKPIRIGYQNEFSIFQKLLKEKFHGIGFDSNVDIYFHESLALMNPFRDMQDHHLAKPEGGGVILGLSHELMFVLTLFESFEVDTVASSLFASDKFKGVNDRTLIKGVGKLGALSCHVSISLSYSPNEIQKIRQGELRSRNAKLTWDYLTGQIVTIDELGSQTTVTHQVNKDSLFEQQILELLESQSRTSSQAVNLVNSHEIMKINELLQLGLIKEEC